MENWELIVTWGFSFVALAISYCSYRKAAKAQVEAHEVQLAGWKRQYLAEYRTWADECCDVLSDAVHLCELDPTKTSEPDFFNRRHLALVNLSSLIDRGRWLFPNDKSLDYGRHKEGAFQGIRVPILDVLNEAYKFMRKADYTDQSQNSELRDELVKTKRAYVTCAQEALDPWGTKADWERFLARIAEMREAPIPGYPRSNAG